MEKQAGAAKLIGRGLGILGVGTGLASGASHLAAPAAPKTPEDFKNLTTQVGSRMAKPLGEMASATASGDWENSQRIQQNLARGHFGNEGSTDVVSWLRNNPVTRTVLPSFVNHDTTEQLMRDRSSAWDSMKSQTMEAAQKGVMTPEIAKSRIQQLQGMLQGPGGTMPELRESINAQIRGLQERGKAQRSFTPQFEDQRRTMLDNGVPQSAIDEWSGIPHGATAPVAGPPGAVDHQQASVQGIMPMQVYREFDKLVPGYGKRLYQQHMMASRNAGNPQGQ